jgi:hypothetical protein
MLRTLLAHRNRLHFRRSSWFAAAIVLLWVSTAAAEPYLRLSGDPCGLTCSETMLPSGVYSIYVLVILSSDLGETTHATQYRITGIPDDWPVAVENGNGVAAAVGDALGAGCLVTFDACSAPSPYGTVVAQRLTVVPTSIETEVTVTIEAAQSPINVQYSEPVVFVCSESGEVPVEVLAGSFWVNAPGGACIGDIPNPTCPQQVDVDVSSWTAVKRLFRE